MTDWPRIALDHIGQGDAVAIITVLAVEGSAPREAGTRMLVWDTGQWDTIGGGNLEHQATAQARRLLDLEGGPAFAVQDYPLGPLLGQCCGGRVRLLIERLDTRDTDWLAEAKRLYGAGQDFELRLSLGGADGDRRARPCGARAGDAVLINGQPARARGVRPNVGDELVCRAPAARPRLLLLGAGHVGQAIARAMAPLPFHLDWRDSRPEVAASTGAHLATPDDLAALAAAGAPFTLVLTHDHALDYALVLAALTGKAIGEAGYLGLIGSNTKRARFTRRLRDHGVGEAALSRLACPIGLAGLPGKAPEIIAASVAADLLIRRETQQTPPSPLWGGTDREAIRVGKGGA